MRHASQLLLFVIIFIISFQFFENPYSQTYLQSLETNAVFTNKNKDSLLEEIKEKAKHYEELPVDAVIDPVWKAIPGYNGIRVDVEKSYQNMRKANVFNKNRLVFQEVPPKISLDDLGAQPIYKGNPQKAMVAFQINVAWGNDYIPKLLKILKDNDVRATFFLDGSWTKSNPRLAKMIADEGHEIGNHAYSHPDMKQLSKQKIYDELKKTNDIIEATVKKKPKWFAPPSGSYRQDVVLTAENLHLKTVLWSVDTVDWKIPDPISMANRVVEQVHPGAMVLMHPTKSTAEGLERMISGIERKGFKIGTVSELLSENRLHHSN